MWAKLSHALKPKQAQDESDTNSHGDVMSSVFEQHPNLSVFHNAPEPHPSPPPSPSKSSRMGLFKRHKDHDESQRAPSPMKLPIASQLSLGPSSSSGPLNELSRASSHDMLSPPASQAKRRSSFNFLKRPSIDGLRSPTEAARSPSRAEESHPTEHDQMRDPSTPLDAKSGSVRFHPSRPQYARHLAKMPSSLPPRRRRQRKRSWNVFSVQGSTDSNTSNSMPRFASSSKSSKPRPTVAEIFSPLGSPEENAPPRLADQTRAIPSSSPDFTNFFDISQDLEMPILPPPGLGFDVEMSVNDTETEGEGGANAMTSTPYRDKGKGKEREIDLTKENLAPTGVDETIFHAKEKAPRLPPALHDRSNSFSLGQTVFYSMTQSDSKRSSTSASSIMGDYPAYPSSAKSSPMSALDSGPPSHTSSPGIKGRGRALSDTVFMSMMRTPSPKPEADINDESSSDLVVYSNPKEPKPEPDPFSAHATTYYTPQTMIPETPPHGAASHARKASKEEDIIFSLKTQLALQTELCGQFETDLHARDELVEVLGKKLSEVEREETKKRTVLKQWKKKVVELERACRYLEEEVEGSRQDSMERSIMDEASSEALRMLHRQIAGLEREKESWKRKEDMLRGELGTLEEVVRERSADVMKLKETLWKRDESERELKQGIKEAESALEMMGNVSIGLIDEEELKKITMVKEQRNEQERERHREAEFGWEEEKEELLAAIEHTKLENAGLIAELDNYKQQLKDHEEEHGMLKSELEAQWDHTEKGAEKLEASEAAKHTVELERDTLKAEVAELEEKVVSMEAEWTDSENKQIELENDIQELWDVKEALEKEREELTEQIREHEGHVETLKQTLQARDDRIIELDQERQYALDNVARLEENIRRRDAEVAEYSQRNLQREAETEELREHMSRLKREHASALEAALATKSAEADQQTRQAKERVGDLKDEIERLRRQIHELQQESADKEVKIVQITKQRAQDKQDLQGLNIALDSKQQELELLKRRMGVRGTGGSTPAQPSKTGHQRQRLGRTDGGSASGAKIPALGKSTRLNNSTSSASATKPAARVPGSMGPPTSIVKPRSSLAGTPTPTPRVGSLSRSASAKPTLSSTPAPVHRRVASATLDQSTARAVKSRQAMSPSPAPSVEKENVEVARPSSSRARVPVPA
ncbi:hypothetical protein DFH09DRAFT_1251237 [Mycena vulgaris]|nr:hypothetical protein DFH09DRAFT_1251237 [Mycena vulgaris]